jgi:hypothetical protein
MAAHRIYHWKHGWIPLDHYAALKKAKGREAGARKYLAHSHAAGHAHASVVSGEYHNGTHERGLQPVAAGHMLRERHIVAAFSPEGRRFGLHDQTTSIATSIPEHLAEHITGKGYRVTGVDMTGNGHRVHVSTPSGERKTFNANGTDKHTVDAPDEVQLGHKTDAQLDDELAQAFADGNPDTVDRIMLEMDRREAQRKADDDILAQLRAEKDARVAAERAARPKRTGGSVDAEVRSNYEAHVYSEWLKAEESTNGVLLNRAGKAAGIDPRSLWSGNADRARKYASEELKTFWQRNGRLSYGAFRAGALNRRTDRGARAANRREGWTDSAA